MNKLTKRKQVHLPYELNSLLSTAKAISVNPSDIDTKAYTQLKKALVNLNKCADIIFHNQKMRGKKFLTAEQIDKIIKKVIEE